MTTVINGTSTSASAPAVVGDDSNSGVYFPSSDQVAIATNGAQALLANANQGIQIPGCLGVGAATPSTSGAGITFPSVANASSNANTLDDYEEGSTTVYFADAPTGGNAYGVGARYIKIGKFVYLNFSAYYDSTPTWTAGNQIYIRGIPFGTQHEGSAGTIMLQNSYGTSYPVHAWQPSGQTFFVVKLNDFVTGILGSNMLTTLTTYGNLVYQTDP